MTAENEGDLVMAACNAPEKMAFIIRNTAGHRSARRSRPRDAHRLRLRPMV